MEQAPDNDLKPKGMINYDDEVDLRPSFDKKQAPSHKKSIKSRPREIIKKRPPTTEVI